jgi:hypothetical protein
MGRSGQAGNWAEALTSEIPHNTISKTARNIARIPDSLTSFACNRRKLQACRPALGFFFSTPEIALARLETIQPEPHA